MSLDVYLYRDKLPPFGFEYDEADLQMASDALEKAGFLDFAEWFRSVSKCEGEFLYGEEFFNANITHNLGEMAAEAGIYQACWRPEEIGAKYARDIIPILTEGLEKLETQPEHYEQFNASNGWGTRTGLVRFVGEYLAACREHPNALISVCR